MKRQKQTLLKLMTLMLPLFMLWVFPAVAAESTVEEKKAVEEKDQKKEKIETVEDMVVTGTRSEEKITAIPAKMEVIKGKAIEMTVGETITEQLKKNASIGVIEYPGALAGIGIRGFRPEPLSNINKRSLILINGRPSGVTNLATLLSGNIERIEVLKGPASSLYGGEAMGGVVNIITKKNTGDLTGSAEIGLGSFLTNFQKGAIGGGIGNIVDFDLNARHYEQADDLTMGNGDKRANTSYMTQNAGLRLGADLGDIWRVDLSGDLYQGRDIETPGDIFNGNHKAGNKDIDHYGVDARVQGRLTANNALTLVTYLSNETAENCNRYRGSGSTLEQVPPYRYYDSDIDWIGAQLKDEFTWRDHSFLVGMDYQEIEKQSRRYNEDGSRKAPSSPDEGRINWAGYLETIWKFMDKKLTATLGGRYDAFEVKTLATPYKDDFTPNGEFFTTFSPRAGLNYKFDRGIRLHTTVGKAFVPPSAQQLAIYNEKEVDGVTMITRGNPSLDPESSVTYDIGAGYDKPRWGIYADLTYFHTDVYDKITDVTRDYTTTYVNSLGAEMEGLEVSFSFDLGAPLNWDRSLFFVINSTHILKAEEKTEEDEKEEMGDYKDIQNVADYTINYGIEYEDKLFESKLHVRNQGPMRDKDWNTANYPVVEYPSFTVVDFTLGIKFHEHRKVSLKIDNLFDEDYYEKKGYPKPGQSFYVSYAIKY